MVFSEENKVQQAIEIGEEALRKDPYLLEIHIKLAEAYECQSKYMNAYKHYCISKLLASYAGDKKVHNDCEQASKRAMERMEQLIAYLPEEQKTFLIQDMIPAFLGYEKTSLDIRKNGFVHLIVWAVNIIMKMRRQKVCWDVS